MTTLVATLRRGLALPLPVLARKVSQRGRGLAHRLVADPASAWRRDGIPPSLPRLLRTGPLARFLVSERDRPGLIEALWSREPEAAAALIAAADEVCAHRFDLLGSGPVELEDRIDWHRDFKSGYRWDLRHYTLLDYLDLGRPSDVKVVWELSRCHHWVTLGQAYRLTRNERYAEEFLAQWRSWMAQNPPGFGVNWTCAMEAAIRAVNWLWAFLLFSEAPAFDEGCQGRFLGALADHGRYIERNLEIGAFPGNHYLTDGVGLLTLGIALREVRGSRRWLARGQRIVWGETERQVTPDGVDYEHAIGYHGYVLQSLLFALTVCRRNGLEVPAAALARVERMLEFALAYTRPDGSIPAIGDADEGRLMTLDGRRAPDHRALLAAGAALFARPDLKAASATFGAENLWWFGHAGLAAYDALAESAVAPGSRAFPEGGFWVMRRGRDRHLIVSGAGKGPASHVHHDLLSFEAWADGIGYVLDPGTYTYTGSPEWRNRFRATASHNTVMVDGQEQTRLLDDPNLFPVERDKTAGFALHSWKAGETLDFFDGQHTGYTRLSHPVIHRRQIWFARGAGIWAVRDLLTGSGVHRVSGFLHLAPLPARVESRDPWVVRVSNGERAFVIAWCPDPKLSISLADGWVSPRYGVIRRAPVITYAKTAAVPMEIRFALIPTGASDPLEIQRVLRWIAELR